MSSNINQQSIIANVKQALEEDIGSGDITASLIPQQQLCQAQIITREAIVLCGQQWVEQAFWLIDSSITIQWHYKEGQKLAKDTVLCTLQGNARNLLSGERTALNFLQTLSGVATLANRYAQQVAHTKAKVLDTRKTIPGLRLALKYAVKTGGCYNHRIGLYDAILIKENHIHATGGIANALKKAQQLNTDLLIEIEVESLDQLEIALMHNAKRILLDNFSVQHLREAVKINNGRASLEASGGITLQNIAAIAETGVEWISTGSLTKDIRSIDLSMLFNDL